MSQLDGLGCAAGPVAMAGVGWSPPGLFGITTDGDHEGDNGGHGQSEKDGDMVHKVSGRAARWPLLFSFEFLAGDGVILKILTADGQRKPGPPLAKLAPARAITLRAYSPGGMAQHR